MINKHILTQDDFEYDSDFKDYQEISNLLRLHLHPISSFLLDKMLHILETELYNTNHAYNRACDINEKIKNEIEILKQKAEKNHEPN